MTLHLSEPTKNIIRQELITYEVVNGQLRKIVVVRDFFDSEYDESLSIIPLVTR